MANSNLTKAKSAKNDEFYTQDKLTIKNLHKAQEMMTSTQLKFLIFVLNKYATAKKVTTATVYNQFDTLGILDDYLIRHYDVLHTLGENYLIEDLSELVNQKMTQK